VLLGINMQTAFMHPPFGFSLFYLRSVAAREPYLDRVTGATIAPITTGQIYWGAAPFVMIQVIMIGLTIAFPGMVTRYKAGEVHIDTTNMQIQAPNFGGGSTGPNFGADNNGAGTNGPNFGAGSGSDSGSGTSGPNFNTGQ
jgi:Tripartite ATP-independent periplasmic transporter, DctM component